MAFAIAFSSVLSRSDFEKVIYRVMPAPACQRQKKFLTQISPACNFIRPAYGCWQRFEKFQMTLINTSVEYADLMLDALNKTGLVENTTVGRRAS